MRNRPRDTGISLIGEAPWGTHFCQFYQTQDDLLEVLVPYFKAGLESNEFCMWITSEPLGAGEAEEALRRAMPDLDRYLDGGQLEILPYGEWYTKGGTFDSQRVLDGWLEKLKRALRRGLEGLRLSGNTFWLEKSDWADFTDYEALINDVIGSYPMMALCTYCLDSCSAHEIIDVIKNHQFALINREGRWEMIQSEEQKRLSGALGESAARLRLATEAAGLGVFEWDVANGRAVWENERMYEIFGYSAQVGIPSKQQLVNEVIHGDDAASFEAALAQGMAPGQMFHNICRIKRGNDGQWRWVEFAGRFELSSQGTPLRLVGVVGDITERKRGEAERERLLAAEQAARAQADAAVKVRDEFMSVAAHELKTPVTSLRGFSQLLVREHARTGGLDPKLIAAAAARIDEQSDRLTKLTERLLDISRIEAGKLVLSRQRTEVSSLVEAVVASVRQAHPSKAFLVRNSPGILADVDGLRVEQVLVNLLDNAAKFSPVEAPIEVNVEMDSQGRVAISVQDRGPGIPEEKRGRLFERFYQAHAQGQYGGMGIGLFVSRQIVDLHGGSITVEQPEDGGSRFVVHLPLSHDREP